MSTVERAVNLASLGILGYHALVAFRDNIFSLLSVEPTLSTRVSTFHFLFLRTIVLNFSFLILSLGTVSWYFHLFPAWSYVSLTLFYYFWLPYYVVEGLKLFLFPLARTFRFLPCLKWRTSKIIYNTVIQSKIPTINKERYKELIKKITFTDESLILTNV